MQESKHVLMLHARYKVMMMMSILLLLLVRIMPYSEKVLCLPHQ